jgi:hypothetical protein
MVWEYNNRYDAPTNGLINSASVLPENFLDLHEMKCVAAPAK